MMEPVRRTASSLFAALTVIAKAGGGNASYVVAAAVNLVQRRKIHLCRRNGYEMRRRVTGGFLHENSMLLVS
jgi:hypothetical protein